MAMIEFEDHSEENQKALLAYLDGEKSVLENSARDWPESRAVARLFAWLRSWFVWLF